MIKNITWFIRFGLTVALVFYGFILNYDLAVNIFYLKTLILIVIFLLGFFAVANPDTYLTREPIVYDGFDTIHYICVLTILFVAAAWVSAALYLFLICLQAMFRTAYRNRWADQRKFSDYCLDKNGEITRK